MLLPEESELNVNDNKLILDFIEFLLKQFCCCKLCVLCFFIVVYTIKPEDACTQQARHASHKRRSPDFNLRGVMTAQLTRNIPPLSQAATYRSSGNIVGEPWSGCVLIVPRHHFPLPLPSCQYQDVRWQIAMQGKHLAFSVNHTCAQLESGFKPPTLRSISLQSALPTEPRLRKKPVKYAYFQVSDLTAGTYSFLQRRSISLMIALTVSTRPIVSCGVEESGRRSV